VDIECVVSEQTTIEQAVAVAERLGYPLVAKIVSPDVVHKTDVGGVIMGLHTAVQVAQAVDTLGERMHHCGARLDGILLQREVLGGIEALIGVTTDPLFGPLVVCGLGGTLVEVVRDVAFRLPPVTDRDAQEMLGALRTSVLLEGYRGAPPGDREAFIGVVLRVSALVDSIPELLRTRPQSGQSATPAAGGHRRGWSHAPRATRTLTRHAGCIGNRSAQENGRKTHGRRTIPRAATLCGDAPGSPAPVSRTRLPSLGESRTGFTSELATALRHGRN
jgi:hypothetical protein